MMLCKPGESHVYNTDIKSSIEAKKAEGWIEVQLGKQPPTPQHILTAGGFWALPQETRESVAKKREARYANETDELLRKMAKDERMGEDISEDQDLFQSLVAKIKQDLPYPEDAPKVKIQSYYNHVR